MIIRTKLSAAEFKNASFKLLLYQRSIRILIIVTIFLSLLDLLVMITGKGQFNYGFIIPIVLAGALIVTTRMRASKVYNTNSQLRETIEYQFTKEGLVVAGETFNSTVDWSNISKATQTQKWLLIWRNNNTAYVIPRKDIWDGDILELKALLTGRNIKNNL